ncbi:hypothetical protein TNCV_687041 [Trichonephila clavipes]|nr:hypothetical protein TNCV_687041 [Trichonephila clavipes]
MTSNELSAHQQVIIPRLNYGRDSRMVKVSDRGWHVMSSSPVLLKTRFVGERYLLNLSKAQTSSHWGHSRLATPASTCPLGTGWWILENLIKSSLSRPLGARPKRLMDKPALCKEQYVLARSSPILRKNILGVLKGPPTSPLSSPLFSPCTNHLKKFWLDESL